MGTSVHTNLGSSQGWGFGDRSYNHTSPRLPVVANAEELQRLLSERPETALRLAQTLLREEAQGKDLSFRYLRQMFSSSFESWHDAQAGLNQENRFKQTNSRLSLVREVLQRLENHSLYSAQAQILMAEYEQIFGFNELESTLRSGLGFLGRNNFERMGVFINLGSSVAGAVGGLISARYAFRGNLGMSIASGVANALFQSGIQLLHQYGEGTDLNSIQIAAELGEAAAAAVLCSFIAYGTRGIEGVGLLTRTSSLLWRGTWSFTKLSLDVGAEYLCNGFSPVKRLLGLEVQGFASTAKGIAYGLAANALGEVLGDATSHLAHPVTHPLQQSTQCYLSEFHNHSPVFFNRGSFAAGLSTLLGGVLASSDLWAGVSAPVSSSTSFSLAWIFSSLVVAAVGIQGSVKANLDSPLQKLEKLEAEFQVAKTEDDKMKILYACFHIINHESHDEQIVRQAGQFLIRAMEGNLSSSNFWSLLVNFNLYYVNLPPTGDVLLLKAAKIIREKLSSNFSENQKTYIPLYVHLLKRCLIDRTQSSSLLDAELAWLYDLLQNRRVNVENRKLIFNFITRSFRNFPESAIILLREAVWFQDAEKRLADLSREFLINSDSALKLRDLLQDEEGRVISSRNNWQTLLEYLCDLEDFNLHRSNKMTVLFYLLLAGAKKKTVFSSLRAINLIAKENKEKILADLATNIALWPAADPQKKQLGRVKRVRAYLYSLFSDDLLESLGLSNIWEGHEELRDHLIESRTMELFSRAALFMNETGKEVLKKLLLELALCKIVNGKIDYSQRYAYLKALGFSDNFIKIWSEEKAPLLIGEVEGKEEAVHVSGLLEDLSRIGILPQETCQRLTTLWNINVSEDPPNLRGEPLNLIRLGQFKVANYLIEGVVTARRIVEISLDHSGQLCLLAERIHPEKYGKDSELRGKIYCYAEELGISRQRVFFAEDASIQNAPQAFAADVYRDTFRQRNVVKYAV